MIFEINPVQSAFLLGIGDPDYNVRNLKSVLFPDGHVWVSLTCKDDGPVLNSRQRYPDVPICRMLDNETDLQAWKCAIPSLLKAVKQHVAN